MPQVFLPLSDFLRAAELYQQNICAYASGKWNSIYVLVASEMLYRTPDVRFILF
jgi:hypothetical protein